MSVEASSISLPLLGQDHHRGHSHGHAHGDDSGVCATQSDSAAATLDGLAIPRSVYLETFGCQMNELDSELVRGRLVSLGYHFTESIQAADVVLYNTCSVRQQAENKVLSRVGIDALRKKDGQQFVLGVIGCLAEREGEAMLRKYPHIDILCGPGELDRLPMLLENALKTSTGTATDRPQVAERAALAGGRSRRTQTLSAADDDLELLDLGRVFVANKGNANGRSAYVRITRGCNKFCTYCVVPHTRGPEIHRPPDAIVEECRRLAEQGVIEVTLLGQTVNHYIYVHGSALDSEGRETAQIGPGAAAFKKNGHANGASGILRVSQGIVEEGASGGVTTFAKLLKRIHDEVRAIKRLRFVTSYPRDFGDDILDVMAESPRICKYLHVPAQSGSNRILKLMNRGYTVEEYLEFVDRARAKMPQVLIAGDFIVGFPTETDEDFEATKRLVERVGFKNNYIFKYSPRPGTVAMDRLADDVPDERKRLRNNELLQLQGRISAEVHRGFVGQEVEVFVEDVQTVPGHGGGAQVVGRQQVIGRTEGDLIAVGVLPDGQELANCGGVGGLMRVVVEESGPLILKGRVVV